MLVGAMNPCPCGFAAIRLASAAARRSRSRAIAARLSGPLRDRLDLTVEVPALPPDVLGALGELSTSANQSGPECSAAVRARVVRRARAPDVRYARRWRAHERGADAGADRAVLRHRRAGARLLESAVGRLALSARAYDRVRKVARTIADLAGADGSEGTTSPRRCSFECSRPSYSVATLPIPTMAAAIAPRMTETMKITSAETTM